MYRFLITSAVVTAFAATPVWADDTTTSGMIARDGLTATLKHLQDQPSGPDRDLALAATGFLAAIQSGYQARWQVGSTTPLANGIFVSMPIIDTWLPPNPDPQPMPDTLINDIMTEMTVAMPQIRAAMPTDAADGALVLKLTDLWFDVTMDGKREPAEDLLAILALPVPAEVQPGIRFDAADLHWLRAYTHVIEGLAQTTLAFDPQPEIATLMRMKQALADQIASADDADPMADGSAQMSDGFAPAVDSAWVILQTLRHQPDPALIDKARGNFQSMIAANRDFWKAVATETDNDREWIPGDAQKAALGFDLPPGTGKTWLAVLDQAEMILNGERLIPHWRFQPGSGIDLDQWLDAPAPVDLLGWIQGSEVMPYAKPGPTIEREAWESFVRMFGGRAGLYMMLLN